MASPRWTVVATVETRDHAIARDMAAALAEGIAETLDRVRDDVLPDVASHGVTVACWTDHETASGPVPPQFVVGQPVTYADLLTNPPVDSCEASRAEAAVDRVCRVLYALETDPPATPTAWDVIREVRTALDGPAASDE